jgi:L-aspartate oxidase
MIGGVTVDLQGRTTLQGLWAAGEVTSSGLHGANRLASNSLLEGLVYGAHAGEGASHAAAAIDDDFRALPLSNPAAEPPPGGEQLDLADIRNSLKSLMWHSAGIRRDHARLSEAAETIEHWRRYVLDRQFPDLVGWQLQNMLTVSTIVIAAALKRQETRGTHQRTDFPATDDAHWNCHLTFRRDGL